MVEALEIVIQGCRYRGQEIQRFCFMKAMYSTKIIAVFALVACVSCASVNLPKPMLDGRIVGGVAINITEAPWQVSLQMGGSHFCGGSIISSQFVITAGHCTNAAGNNPANIRIRAGSSAHRSDGEILEVKRVFQHEKFSMATIDYDFALLELKNPIEFDDTKQPIKLHNFDENFGDDTMCFISGWGNTQSVDETNLYLRRAEVPIVNQKKCVDAYASVGGITPRMICAGLTQGGRDSCQGDSGGPLATLSKVDGKPRLVGIVSWGYGCAKPNYPGVYARVLAGREWILQKSGI